MSISISVRRILKLEDQDRISRYSIDFIKNKVAKKFRLSSSHHVPSILKIVLSLRSGKLRLEKSSNNALLRSAFYLSGQTPVITKSIRAIANFKVKRGEAVGLKVTLRKRKMFEFLDRFINLSLPRVRDFRGISPKTMDHHCNLNIGVTELSIFHEVPYERFSSENGLNVCIVSNSFCKEVSEYAFRSFGIPLKQEAQNV